MSNFALDQLMQRNGINVIRTDVGDKYVVEEMRRGGFGVGGEQSGHIIFLNHTTTGDGLIASLSVLAVMKHKNRRLSELNQVMEDVPQVLINTRVSHRKELEDIPGYIKLMERLNQDLKGVGRTFVRFSGTEPVVRVLVEGPDKRQIAHYAEEIASLLQKELS
jgi:phosphoglucosamine mutase